MFLRLSPWRTGLRRTLTTAAPFTLLFVASMVQLAVIHEARIEAEESKPAVRYVGDASCASCHALQGKFYEKTSHRLTLQLPSKRSILGSFQPGSNVLQTLDPKSSLLGDGLSFQMQIKDNYFYQTARRSEIQDLDQTIKVSEHTERIDLVTGSGVRGQSYLYWKTDELYELPVSYWSEGRRWINSPGYPDGSAIFDRPVTARCLECHTTFVEAVADEPHGNRYIASSLIGGITCEKCHGPGARHVELEKESEASKRLSAEAIINPKRFSRDRQVDLCALCHNGAKREARTPAFSFIPGQPLDASFGPEPVEESAEPEIHGNQVGLLKRSRCYQSSPTMTCSTCHDEHALELPADDYSERCLSCHTVDSCGVAKASVHSNKKGCIGCHMPIQPTNAIVSETGGRVVRARIRTHWIRVYR